MKLVITEDNSHTIYNEEIGEHYHSTHGAIQESAHIFINSGLRESKSVSSNLNILEIGMGTGLNVLLTYVESDLSGKRINYVSVEAYPVEKEIYNKLNYAELLGNPLLNKVLNEIHEKPWNVPFYLTDSFILNKINAQIQDVQLAENVFDVVYFDAFSPQSQPELWTEEMFKNIYNSMKNNGVLTTYSSKGDVKRALKNAGFKIEILAGPIGKRHIIRAIKEIEMCDCKHHSHVH